MIVQLINDTLGMINVGTLAVLPDAVAFAYYILLMSIGSLIALRIR